MIQQQMPVAKETVEKTTPIITKAGKEITEGMAPAYGAVAKEIAKGIKEGKEEGAGKKAEK